MKGVKFIPIDNFHESNYNNPNISEGDKTTHDLELQTKLKKFRTKFNITKERLLKEDIISIFKLMDKDKTNNYEEITDKIFKDLDKNNRGYVETNNLIENLLIRDAENNSNTNDEFYEFYNSINQALHTKSEDIIYRLKKLKKKEWISISPELLDAINFVIKSITEANLNELDSEEFSHKTKGNEQNGIEYLVKYSRIEDSKQKERDIVQLRKKSKIYISSSNFKKGVDKESTDSKMGYSRRPTNLANMISPSIIARVYSQISKIDQCDFNIFELDELMGKKASIYIATEILRKFDLIDCGIVDQDKLKNFIAVIVEHYDRVNAMYHNDLHAADVMQTVFAIIVKGDLQNKMRLTQLDMFSMLVGALCHDYKHTGQNNMYHINAKTKLAMRYNDISVLENYHLAQSFKVIESTDILKNFTPEEYRICRRRMIEGILSTDMANHQKVLAATKTQVELHNIVKGVNFTKIFEEHNNIVKLFDNQQCILNMILHSADISNPGKPNRVSEQWTKRVYGEFFNQGDLEKKENLPISTFCDRNTTNINKAMVGFIKFVVAPTIDLLINLIPEVGDYSDYCRSNLRKHQNGVKEDEKKEQQKNKNK